MVVLMLRMCNPIFVTRKYSVLDSGFCVEKVIVQLEAKRFYAVSITKKWRYWPNSLPPEDRR